MNSDNFFSHLPFIYFFTILSIIFGSLFQPLLWLYCYPFFRLLFIHFSLIFFENYFNRFSPVFSNISLPIFLLIFLTILSIMFWIIFFSSFSTKLVAIFLTTFLPTFQIFFDRLLLIKRNISIFVFIKKFQLFFTHFLITFLFIIYFKDSPIFSIAFSLHYRPLFHSFFNQIFTPFLPIFT